MSDVVYYREVYTFLLLESVAPIVLHLNCVILSRFSIH